MLDHLQWRTGTAIVVELGENAQVIIRKPNVADLADVTIPKSFELST